jgi:hypothetical protein
MTSMGPPTVDRFRRVAADIMITEFRESVTRRLTSFYISHLSSWKIISHHETDPHKGCHKLARDYPCISYTRKKTRKMRCLHG